jgi:hypothetical protein
MATNYAQKLQREKQSPKGNVLGKIAVGAKKILSSTGWMKKATPAVDDREARQRRNPPKVIEGVKVEYETTGRRNYDKKGNRIPVKNTR